MNFVTRMFRRRRASALDALRARALARGGMAWQLGVLRQHGVGCFGHRCRKRQNQSHRVARRAAAPCRAIRHPGSASGK